MCSKLLGFETIQDTLISAVRARDHVVSFVIKKKQQLEKTRSDVSFEGGEEEIEDIIEDPF